VKNQRLTLASAKLARGAPALWDEFMTALAAEHQTTIQALISSPPDQLATAQGRAQLMTALLTLMSTCVKDADQITEKAKK
jgi:hypothetical protein